MDEIERISKNINGENIKNTPNLTITGSSSSPEESLENVKEIVELISNAGEKWLSDQEWEASLPNWFIDVTKYVTEEDIDKNDHLWDFGSWLDAIKHRAWEWHSSKMEDGKVIIMLQIIGMPFMIDAFLYLMFVSGFDHQSLEIVENNI